MVLALIACMTRAHLVLAVGEVLAVQGEDLAEVVAPELKEVEGIAVLGVQVVVLDEPAKNKGKTPSTNKRVAQYELAHLLFGWSEARKPWPLR